MKPVPSAYTNPRHLPADLTSTRRYINYVRSTHLHVARTARDHTLRVSLHHAPTAPRALVQVLTPQLLWTTLVDLHPDLWAGDFVAPHEGAHIDKVRAQAEDLADALLLRGVELLSGS